MEMLLYLFASVGILYLMRGVVHFILYRKRSWGLYLEVPLCRYDGKSFCELLSVVSLIKESIVGKRVLRGIALTDLRNCVLSRREAEALAEIYGVEIKKRHPKRVRRRFVRR
jgi:hypothetical protein